MKQLVLKNGATVSMASTNKEVKVIKKEVANIGYLISFFYFFFTMK